MPEERLSYDISFVKSEVFLICEVSIIFVIISIKFFILLLFANCLLCSNHGTEIVKVEFLPSGNLWVRVTQKMHVISHFQNERKLLYC